MNCRFPELMSSWFGTPSKLAATVRFVQNDPSLALAVMKAMADRASAGS